MHAINNEAMDADRSNTRVVRFERTVEERTAADPPAREEGRTPYQIFRSSTATAAASVDEAPLDDLLNITLDDDNDTPREDDDDESNIGDEHNADEADKENLPTSSATVGVLSPNSAEIRRNAQRLLMRHQPRNKRSGKSRRKARMSLPLMPQNTNLLNVRNATDRHDKPEKTAGKRTTTNNGNRIGSSNEFHALHDLKRELEDFDIQRELEADLEEIREAAKVTALAAKDMASRAVEAGNDAFGALSRGAWDVVGQLWE